MTMREFEAIERYRLRRFWAWEGDDWMPVAFYHSFRVLPEQPSWKRGIWQTTPGFVR